MSNEEKALVVLDCEVYPNYFLVSFKNLKTGKIVSIESKGADKSLDAEATHKIKNIMTNRVTFGFNSRNYDMPIILYALAGNDCKSICELSNNIIENNMQGWQTLSHYNLILPKSFDHFDIQEPAPAVRISLKLYGGRMNSARLQDLPIKPNTTLTQQQMLDIKEYCTNDLETTIDLYKAIESRIDLRVKMGEKYKQDLRSKSDAQIAEAVIKSEIQKLKPRLRIKKPTLPDNITFKYNPPDYLKFETENLKNAFHVICSHNFELDARGSIKLPDQLKKLKITLGKSTYKLGIGGIHSTEKKQAIVPTSDQLLIDKDVASYYPSIILNLGLYPEHLGKGFLEVYQSMVTERLAAKNKASELGKELRALREKLAKMERAVIEKRAVELEDEIASLNVIAGSFKISCNGSFGKLGSKYSFLYSPDLMVQVTLTGQLALMMLIEELELFGVSVMSANTDGFVTLLNKSQHDEYQAICKNWEHKTGFVLEDNIYSGLYSRDVNNYLAVTETGAKGKGIFTLNQLSKNPQVPICTNAVIELITNGIGVAETIRSCTDLTQFITVRSVTGGAVWRSEYLGRVVRWIYSTDGDVITYEKNGNKVAKSDGAMPVMTLGGTLPSSIDYQRYINETYDILENIGYFDF